MTDDDRPPRGPERPTSPGNPDRPEPAFVAGLSPRQVVGGFAFVAAIILWLARRSRRGRGKG